MSQQNRKIKRVQSGWKIPLRKEKQRTVDRALQLEGMEGKKSVKRKQSTPQQGKHKIATLTNGWNSKDKHLTEWNPT